MVVVWFVVGIWIACAVLGAVVAGSHGFKLGITLGVFGLLVALLFEVDRRSSVRG